MGWSAAKRCAVVTCNKPADRHVEWSAKVAGDSHLCEDHYKEYRRRFPHLTILKSTAKPDERFSEKGRRAEAQEGSQLEL